MQRRKGKLAQDAAKIAVGAGAPELKIEQMRTAHASLMSQGKLPEDFNSELVNRPGWEGKELLLGHRKMLEEESQRILIAEGERVGLKDTAPKAPFGRQASPLQLEEKDRFRGWDFMAGLSSQIAKRGGTTNPGQDDIINRAAGALDRDKKLFEGPVIPPMAIPGPGASLDPNAPRGEMPGMGWRSAVAANMIGALPIGRPAEPGVSMDALRQMMELLTKAIEKNTAATDRNTPRAGAAIAGAPPLNARPARMPGR
jgi:hypothetical protein